MKHVPFGKVDFVKGDVQVCKRLGTNGLSILKYRVHQDFCAMRMSPSKTLLHERKVIEYATQSRNK